MFMSQNRSANEFWKLTHFLKNIVFESQSVFRLPATYGLLLECEEDCVFAGISQTTNNEMQLLLALILHFVSLTLLLYGLHMVQRNHLIGQN